MRKHKLIYMNHLILIYLIKLNKYSIIKVNENNKRWIYILLNSTIWS